MKIKTSIIIPTYKRKESLLRLLESLKKEVEKESEIIVVEQVFNNGKEIMQIAQKNGLNLQHFYLKEASTSKAKNFGAKKAKGDFLLFLDDDVVIKKGLINNHLKNFKNTNFRRCNRKTPLGCKRNIGAVAGRVMTTGQKIEEDRKDVGRITFLGSFTDGFSSKIKQEVDTVIGCNACFRKDVFEKLNGFDEQFSGNAMREESDLSLRARKLGYKIIFEPKACVEHLREPSGGNRKTEGRMKWYFDFFSNETYFFLKHRSLIIVPLILLTRWEWMLRCMFGIGREVSLRSITTPFLGIMDGIKKYRRIRF